MSPKGRERRGGGKKRRCVHLCVSAFECLLGAPHSQIAAQAGSPSTGRERSEADQTQAN